jgi:4-hydroxybenzoate polyprenyltransferase
VHSRRWAHGSRPAAVSSRLPWSWRSTVLLWVAGFDTLYAGQDVEFDRREGLRSLPASLGVPPALMLARLMPALTVLLLLLFRVVPLHPVYLAGVSGVAESKSSESAQTPRPRLGRAPR